MRIVPRLNEAVNEEWISDKARFQYDGLKRQRLNVPLVKGADGALAPATWSDALAAAAAGLSKAQGNGLKAIAGKLADAESIIALKVPFYFSRRGRSPPKLLSLDVVLSFKLRSCRCHRLCPFLVVEVPCIL